MAERFARGGRLVALGRSPAARSDARHVAVEFVHPVIVGKRALPAIGLAAEGGPLAAQVDAVAEPDDIAIAFGAEERRAETPRRARARARQRGCLTIAFGDAGRRVGVRAPRRRPVRAPGAGRDALPRALGARPRLLRPPRPARGPRGARRHDAGASSFLYPFLAEAENDLDAVLEDVRRSVLMKADEVGELREQTLDREPRGAARGRRRAARRCFDAGGKLLAVGNGGSATDAMDLVADLRAAPQGWPARRAIDLTEDASILTAIANDIGVEADLPAPGDRLRARGRRARSRSRPAATPRT